MIFKNSTFLFAFLLVSCGYPKPRYIKETNEYELYYCEVEEKCFEAAEKTCPNGYIVTRYGSIRPEKFRCK